jgi:MerR family transcriptional regulator, heat shock protein HspR
MQKRHLYLKDVADYCGLETDVIEQLIDSGLLHLVSPDKEEDFLTEDDLELLHRVRRLQNTFGVNLAGIEVIVHMREQILYLQNELRRLQHITYKDEEKNTLEE